ncbi:primosomal protein N' [Aliibacillus thermotolerans]|uniref:Replication restart protein PriA n=1 Tax=Aliibacillus thermotolerans TaxID=1834418 RepID=A0ABW0U5X8_9BACI|nr:primosomal protein N' [Aliibacillus thermotolerans]MDA3130665.1 primosomal protein N' [Aliibacillus thermotolerans]
MYAKVIVDIPALSLDKAFDYKVPENYQLFIQVGMRVLVPFGKRKIQGIVWQLTNETDVEQVKTIAELLDPYPVLTNELLRLGEWLAKETTCFLSSAYGAMIPSAIRAKPKKMIQRQVKKEQLPPVLQAVFANKQSVLWKELPKEAAFLSTLKQEIERGHVVVDYVLKNKIEKKTILCVRLVKTYTDEEIAKSIHPSAKKQRKMLEWLQERSAEDWVPVKDVLAQTNTSMSVVHTLVEKGFLQKEKREIYRDPYEHRNFEVTTALSLTSDQARVLTDIEKAITEEKARTYLLRGVTGSGKTEVYLQAIEHVLQKGKEAIVLVPEISLTPQMVERFKGRFGSLVAVLHSALSQGEKYDEWRKILKKEVKVVVGARSAVFAPFENIGLIVIDEEHESSYKQEDHPRYHARDVAIWRGKYHRAPVLLGSATPSLESYARAMRNVYQLLELPSRVNRLPLPHVDIIDMRQELKKGNRTPFSETLFQKMKERLEKKEQTVLFLNRRGFSTFVMCRTCGYTAECPHCEITLTYHHTGRLLKCHYCGHEEPLITTCPACSSEQIRFFGTGTQKVEAELTKLLPEAKVIRMDVDTTSKKGSHEKLLQAFGKKEADILLGTQMIAKGLDFPDITLVGVLAADTLLHLPDFRAAERTFQLLTQVSGRAGREKRPGEVVIQTYSPDHYSIQHAKSHDYIQFAQREMYQRKETGYPPYYYMTLITVAHEDVMKTMKTAENIAKFLRHQLSSETKVLGPTVSPIARIKDRYRYQCMIKYRNEPSLKQTLGKILQHYQQEIEREHLLISIDNNPQMFM